MWERRPWQPQQGLAEETRTEDEVAQGAGVTVSPFVSEVTLTNLCWGLK
jgi:hypothetical protein